MTSKKIKNKKVIQQFSLGGGGVRQKGGLDHFFLFLFYTLLEVQICDKKLQINGSVKLSRYWYRWRKQLLMLIFYMLEYVGLCCCALWAVATDFARPAFCFFRHVGLDPCFLLLLRWPQILQDQPFASFVMLASIPAFFSSSSVFFWSSSFLVFPPVRPPSPLLLLSRTQIFASSFVFSATTLRKSFLLTLSFSSNSASFSSNSAMRSFYNLDCWAGTWSFSVLVSPSRVRLLLRIHSGRLHLLLVLLQLCLQLGHLLQVLNFLQSRCQQLLDTLDLRFIFFFLGLEVGSGLLQADLLTGDSPSEDLVLVLQVGHLVLPQLQSRLCRG